jgi:hypothetical protein
MSGACCSGSSLQWVATTGQAVCLGFPIRLCAITLAGLGVPSERLVGETRLLADDLRDALRKLG